MTSGAGPLALVGGDEFHPGNEAQDEVLSGAAGGRPAYVVATAAREHPDSAVATATRWFARFGLDVQELRARTRTEAQSPATAGLAREAGFVYIAGGDPGHVVTVLRGSAVWAAVVEAWRHGAALAGSSAGAMALCRWTLVRVSWPGHAARRPIDALTLLDGCAVLPHFDTFGERWIPSAQQALGSDTLLIGVDERCAALWQDGVWRAAGAGAVTLIRGSERRRYARDDEVPLPQPEAMHPHDGATRTDKRGGS